MSKVVTSLFMFAFAFAPVVARAEAPPPVTAAEAEAPPPAPSKRLGVGYKIGNGLGFVGGDVVVNVVDHLALDVQANWISIGGGVDGTATGWGLGGEVQVFLKADQVSSPFLAVGLAHAHLALHDVTGSATGYFANAGYEFRWRSGLGVLLGAGVGDLRSVHASSPDAMLDTSGGVYFNVEAGVRFMFL